MSSSPAIAEGGAALGSAAAEAAATETAATSQRRFLVGFLGSFFAAFASVLALNVVVDPFALAGTGVVPTAVEPDRLRSRPAADLGAVELGHGEQPIGSAGVSLAQPRPTGKLHWHAQASITVEASEH
jgi:hypothetical protein